MQVTVFVNAKKKKRICILHVQEKEKKVYNITLLLRLLSSTITTLFLVIRWLVIILLVELFNKFAC